MSALTTEEIIKRWDKHAEEYANLFSTHGDRNREVLLTPLILSMLGDISGCQVLDAGCGEGYLSRLMVERGALVTGVDYSKKLLHIAQDRTTDRSAITYLHANLENLELFTADIFDTVVSCLVIQAVPDYQAAINEMVRVLRPGGTCILALTHPCFSSDGGWIRDSEGKKLYWKIDNYFHERGEEIHWPKESVDNPINYHRTLTSYLRTILQAGFILEDLVEPCPSENDIVKHPNFKDDIRMTHFLVLKLKKRCSPSTSDC